MGCFCTKHEEVVETQSVFIMRRALQLLVRVNYISIVHCRKTYSMRLRKSVRAKLRPSVFTVNIRADK